MPALRRLGAHYAVCHEPRDERLADSLKELEDVVKATPYEGARAPHEVGPSASSKSARTAASCARPSCATRGHRISGVEIEVESAEYSPNLWQTTSEKDMPNLRDFIKGAWDNRASEKSYMKILRGAKTKVAV